MHNYPTLSSNCFRIMFFVQIYDDLCFFSYLELNKRRKPAFVMHTCNLSHIIHFSAPQIKEIYV